MMSIGKFAVTAALAGVLALTVGGCSDDGDGNPTDGGGGSQFNPKISYGEFTDPRDKQTYRTVEMPDGKTWMAENLNVTTEDSWCYDDKPANCATYGRLYTWLAAMEACPVGWHLPTNEEWLALETAVGGSSKAGTILKSSTGWYSHSEIPAGTDEYGFSALPARYNYYDGSSVVGRNGYWWAATEFLMGDVYNKSMYYDEVYVGTGWAHRGNAFSVRCVRD